MTGWRDDRPPVIEGFLAGDERVLAEVYGRWSPLVYSIALNALNSVAEAEEVTQRVFTGAWNSRRSFEPDRGGLSAWLTGLTVQAIAQAQGSRDKPTHPPAQTRTDELAPADVAERLVLVDEVSRWEADPQTVLRMALHDELTSGEIAERTGMAPATVTGHIRRSLLRLRKRLEVQTDAC